MQKFWTNAVPWSVPSRGALPERSSWVASVVIRSLMDPSSSCSPSCSGVWGLGYAACNLERIIIVFFDALRHTTEIYICEYQVYPENWEIPRDIVEDWALVWRQLPPDLLTNIQAHFSSDLPHHRNIFWTTNTTHVPPLPRIHIHISKTQWIRILD